MRVTATKLTSDQEYRRACEMTLRPGQTSKVTWARLLMCEHSPIRAVEYWIEMHGIPTFVSVHLVRHKLGVEHFVMSNRDDRGGAGDDQVTRLSPVNHGMKLNAATVLAISRKRLCFNSHRTTVAVWMRVKRAIRAVDSVMADHMVPECVYRGFCPELKQCAPGVKKVIDAYGDSPYCQQRNKQLDESK